MSSISALSSIGSQYPVSNSSQTSSSSGNFNLFEQLASALQSGNLSGAQQAYSSLSAAMQNSSSAQSNSPLSADLNALGQALQSGNLPAGAAGFREPSASRDAAGRRGQRASSPSRRWWWRRRERPAPDSLQHGQHLEQYPDDSEHQQHQRYKYQHCQLIELPAE